jgi:hypothetical protein
LKFVVRKKEKTFKLLFWTLSVSAAAAAAAAGGENFFRPPPPDL